MFFRFPQKYIKEGLKHFINFDNFIFRQRKLTKVKEPWDLPKTSSCTICIGRSIPECSLASRIEWQFKISILCSKPQKNVSIVKK